MLSLDDEDYEALGLGPSQFELAAEQCFTNWKRLWNWIANNAERAKRARRLKEKRRRARRAAEGIRRKQRNEDQRQAQKIYMREYRKTAAGKAATKAATKKFRSSPAGKQARSLWNKAQYLRKKAEREQD